jgi:hypothetical protein
MHLMVYMIWTWLFSTYLSIKAVAGYILKIWLKTPMDFVIQRYRRNWLILIICKLFTNWIEYRYKKQRNLYLLETDAKIIFW